MTYKFTIPRHLPPEVKVVLEEEDVDFAAEVNDFVEKAAKKIVEAEVEGIV